MTIPFVPTAALATATPTARPADGVTSPEIGPLLDVDALAHRLSAAGMPVTSIEPTYLRHKPGETTIVGYRACPVDAADSAPRTWLHLRWCADSDRADQMIAKARTLQPVRGELGPSVVRLDPGTVAYGFPVDPGLPRLRWWTDPRKLKRSLEELGRERGGVSSRTVVEVLRYKPQRRLVARVDLRTVDGDVSPLLVRYGTGATAHRLQAVAAALRAAGVRCPAPVYRGENGRVSVDRFVPGRSLREAVDAGDGDADAVADALARFHATPAPPIDRLPHRLPSRELARAHAGLAGLRALRSELGEITDRLGRALTASTPPDPAPDLLRLVHGDLHTGNIVVATGDARPGDCTPGDSAEPCFVDLDRVATGLPVMDLASLLAQGIALPIRWPDQSADAVEHAAQVVATYRHRSTAACDDLANGDPSLAWHTAVALIDQALLPLRQFAADGGATADLVLKTAIDVLDCLDPCGAFL